MAKYFSEKNLKFLLYDVLDVEKVTQFDYYQDHNKTVFDMVIKSADKLAKDLFDAGQNSRRPIRC